jgi:NitT/TauT family transport system ATP-binding protein
VVHASAPADAANAPVLEAAGLTLDYQTELGSVRAVENVDFTFARGERLVLLGPSGCGKSSILKAVAGFLPPAAGSVMVEGRTVTGPGPDRIVVFQEFDQLLPWKSVVENVAFPLRVARRLSRKAAHDVAAVALGKVGLSHVLDSYPHTLSGGMKQRVAIARALAVEPDILLMDEPFAALDALTRRKLQEDLLGLAEELRFTLLFVTHAIAEAILIGTRLHLLSAHPGRTLATFDTSKLTFADVGSHEFETVARLVHDRLFGRKGAHIRA